LRRHTKAQVPGSGFKGLEWVQGRQSPMTCQVRFSYLSFEKSSFARTSSVPQSRPIAALQQIDANNRSKQTMNGSVIGRLGNKNIWSPKPFKDLCASIGLARAIRSEYFSGLIHGWNRKDRPAQKQK
jgi:hypothetical protein